MFVSRRVAAISLPGFAAMLFPMIAVAEEPPMEVAVIDQPVFLASAMERPLRPASIEPPASSLSAPAITAQPQIANHKAIPLSAPSTMTSTLALILFGSALGRRTR